MTAPNRNNGLSAERWAPLVDLEPQFADALLEALREEGVAAYASPAPGIRGPYMDIQLPNTPTDRVWVDAGATDTARHVFQTRRADFGPDESDRDDSAPVTAPAPAATPEPEEQDFEAAFRAIVAGYGKTGTEQVAPWSPAEDVENETPNAGGSWRVLRRAEPDDSSDDADDEGWGVVEGAGPKAVEPAEPDEHYVPPPPPPLPRVDKHTKLSWVGVIGGPLFLILFTALDWSPIPYATFFAIAAFIGGFASLVYRMTDDGPGHSDDGAIV
ncbi:hypothetical protein [Sporichthya sp.]|uniref:hypothetical protein n=1 Tax=Sporichthya sp. TaxID=65475 RepID=UPI0017E831DC|nr:hypothetical protein [Sporichthya sp.]MBA3745227.1 hypothetical protein [Sporichthya sp.]